MDGKRTIKSFDFIVCTIDLRYKKVKNCMSVSKLELYLFFTYFLFYFRLRFTWKRTSYMEDPLVLVSVVFLIFFCVNPDPIYHN